MLKNAKKTFYLNPRSAAGKEKSMELSEFYQCLYFN